MKKLSLFIMAFLLWMLLTWPADPAVAARGDDVMVGLVVAALVTAVMKEISPDRAGRWLNPVRWFWALCYMCVFTYYVLKANVDVAYRVLHPDMPIEPGIVKVKTSLRSAEARTALANSVTLTPGTLTIDMTDDGTLYIHWINVKTKDTEEATRQIIGRFEWFLKRIMD